MMKRRGGKLPVKRETVRTLQSATLEAVAGARPPVTRQSACAGDCPTASSLPSCDPPLFTDLC